MHSSDNEEAIDDAIVAQIVATNISNSPSAPTINGNSFLPATPIAMAGPNNSSEKQSVQPSSLPIPNTPIQTPNNAAMDILILELAQVKAEMWKIQGPDYTTIPTKEYMALKKIASSLIEISSVIQVSAKDANVFDNSNKFQIGSQEVEFSGADIAIFTGKNLVTSKIKLVAKKIGLDLHGVLIAKN